MEILLNKQQSKKSVNVQNIIATQLKGGNKLLPQGTLFTSINENTLYDEERNACNIIRLNCVINPICSNVLFNNITEVVKNEGSPTTVKSMTYGRKEGCWNDDELKGKVRCKESRMFMYGGSKEFVRDTQVTSKECGYEYHCGIDIFNNHLLRNNTFKSVCYSPLNERFFNTINDYMRDENGSYIKGEGYEGRILTKQHLYLQEDIETYENTIDKKLKEKNGWFGFINTGSFSVVDNNNEPMDIFRVINYKRSCDFIQMYPSSDLWSFTPKYNPHIHRLEKNWNYCLTYPSTSTTKNITFIREANNALRAMYVDDRVKLKSGIEAIKIYSISKHGLKKGDFVNLYKNNDIVLNGCEVKEVENDYVFYLFSAGVELIDSWYELTKEDTATNGQDDFIVKRDIPLAKYSFKINGKEITQETETFKAENGWTIEVNENGEFETISYHGKVYDSTTVKKGDIRYTIEYVTENTCCLKDVYVNMDVQYLITSNRTKVYNGEGDERATYYLIDNKYVNIDDNAQDFSFKQVVNGGEVDYYVRIFSRLPNWKYCDKLVDKHQIYYADKYLLPKYQSIENEFENHISQLAFAKNIYGDDMSQIVFTDDIDISYLRDNLGRPLSSIYLTILKNNKGYKEWYGKNGVDIEIRKRKGDKDEDYHIEYSHCFGMLNCAFRLSKESLPHVGHNNSMQINNINSSFQYQGLDVEDIQLSTEIYDNAFNEDTVINDSGINDKSLWERPYRSRFSTILNDEIQYGYVKEGEDEYFGDVNFYGDLCSYSKKTLNETSIQQIEMRFNTAQREVGTLDKSYQYFNKMYYDEILSDDLDKQGFSSKEYVVNNANQRKEGYCYHPHYEIPIKSFSNYITSQPSIAMTLVKIEAVSQDNHLVDMHYKMKTMNKHNLQVNDTVYMKYTFVNEVIYYVCYVTDIIDEKWFECVVYDENNKQMDVLDVIDVIKYKLFKKDSEIPDYATFLKDGSCRFVWREMHNNGFDNNSPIEKYPFMNGAFYVNKQINLFVRRQDPNEYTSLQTGQFPNDKTPNIIKFENNYYKENDIIC